MLFRSGPRPASFFIKKHGLGRRHVIIEQLVPFDVVFRQNDNGRIYGVTFIDHDSRVVLNGSRLGKEYSANVFNDLYSDERKTDIRQEQSTHQEQPDFTPKADLISGVASVVSAFGGLLGGTSGGDEPQDTARQKRKKKKKRTRRID